MRTVTIALALLALTAACGDSLPDCKYGSYKDVGEPVDVCTTEIDLEEGECFEPAQICPNRNVMNFCYQELNSPNPYPPVTLQLRNAGRKPLTVSKVELLGDTRCSYQPPRIDPALGTPIKPGDSMLVELAYDPSDDGADHVQVRIESDAENFPELILGACGEGLQPGAEPEHEICGEGGFVCEVPASTEVVSCG